MRQRELPCCNQPEPSWGMQRTQQGKGKKGRGEGREGNKSITPRSPLPASPSHCARRPRQKFPAPPAAGRDATGFVATGCLVPSPLPDPPSNVLVASKISMSGLTDEGWCSGREREPRKQTGSAPGIAAVSISPSLLSGFAFCVWLLAAYSSFTWAASSPANCTDAQEPESLSRDHLTGGEAMRSEPFAKKPIKCWSPPNPGHAQPPVVLGLEGQMQQDAMLTIVFWVLSQCARGLPSACLLTSLKTQKAEVTPSDGDLAPPAAPEGAEGAPLPPHWYPAPKG